MARERVRRRKIIGQLQKKQCPLCQGENSGKWTCAPCTDLVNTHRELVRNLQVWHSLFEALEVEDTITSSDGREYSLWDVEYFYAQRTKLPAQQRKAIELYLFDNHKEQEAAVMMGLTRSSPIGIYATVGITTLLSMAHRGEFPGYRLTREGVDSHEHASSE